ncbi:hypothetical protein ACFLYS_00425 [Chloroflexota bacterium]
MKHIRTRFLITVTTLLLVSSLILTGCGIISTGTSTSTTTVREMGATETVTQIATILGDVTDSSIEPFAWGGMFPSNANSVSFTIPTNKRLVIEWVTASFRCPPHDPGSPDSMVLPWIQATFDSEWVIYFLAISDVQVDHNQRTRFTTTQFVKIYTDPGGTVEVGFSYSGSIPEATYSVSGYLVDVP